VSARVQAAYDVIVIGAGLAGLFAGALAARAGARTLVAARGQGGLPLGPGCVDIWGYSRDAQGARHIVQDPGAGLSARLAPEHPLRLAGGEAVTAGLAAFQALCAEAGYPLAGSLDRNHLLPTALGTARPTCLAPESFLAGDLRDPSPIILADLRGFRDFHAPHAAANLRRAGHAARAVALDLPRWPARRAAFATDLARRLDVPAYRAEAADLWRPHLAGAARLGLPAILGLSADQWAWRDLSERLGLALFEIPTVPPSVPGLRLFNVLQDTLEAAGGRLILGPEVSGWVEAGAVRGVILHSAGGPRRYAAPRLILATGGFRHGGLDAPAPGVARETVLDLPVLTEPDWYAPLYWDPHPYARFGVRVNTAMQPVDAEGRVLHANVHAIGGLLAGADRHDEGCREGVDLATAWAAVQAAFGQPAPDPQATTP
jgi:glycerol-3-phosphate dehydrogenase subunit B